MNEAQAKKHIRDNLKPKIEKMLGRELESSKNIHAFELKGEEMIIMNKAGFSELFGKVMTMAMALHDDVMAMLDEGEK